MLHHSNFCPFVNVRYGPSQPTCLAFESSPRSRPSPSELFFSLFPFLSTTYSRKALCPVQILFSVLVSLNLRLFLTEKSSACTMYPAPRNGTLGCINITFSSLGVVPICYAMCKSEFDFVSKAERIYVCYQGQWKTRLLEPALPWPDCSGKPKAIITEPPSPSPPPLIRPKRVCDVHQVMSGEYSLQTKVRSC